MKRYLINIAFFLFCFNINAQKYIVYAMVGKVNVNTKNGTRPMRLRETIIPTTKVTIPYNSSLELFDQENRRKYVINTPGTASVKDFINDKRNNTIELTARIFAFMLRRIASKENTLIQSCSDPAAVTREELKDSTIYVVRSDTFPDTKK